MLHMCVNFGERAGETESHFRCTVMLGRGDGIAQLCTGGTSIKFYACLELCWGTRNDGCCFMIDSGDRVVVM